MNTAVYVVRARVKGVAIDDTNDIYGYSKGERGLLVWPNDSRNELLQVVWENDHKRTKRRTLTHHIEIVRRYKGR